jgi:hypothetical protein
MSADWYIRQDGKTRGPVTPQQLRALARKSVITRHSTVRKGKLGDWVPASRVKGLFETMAAPGKNSDDAAHQPTATTPDPGSYQGDEESVLVPHRRIRARLITLLLLVGFVCIGPSPWYQKILFAISMVLIFGAFPIIRVTQKTIEQTIVVGFYPVHTKRWKLRDFSAVETDIERRITETFGLLVLFFWVFWLLFRIFDHLMPWMGGDYKIFLRQFDDERLLIWQGNRDVDFETNREILEDAVQRAGFRW